MPAFAYVLINNQRQNAPLRKIFFKREREREIERAEDTIVIGINMGNLILIINMNAHLL